MIKMINNDTQIKHISQRLVRRHRELGRFFAKKYVTFNHTDEEWVVSAPNKNVNSSNSTDMTGVFVPKRGRAPAQSKVINAIRSLLLKQNCLSKSRRRVF
jgi:hypothetical protein